MKITILQGAFLPVPPLLGGAVEKVWYRMARQFAEMGHEVTHLTRAFKDLPMEETVHGVHYLRFPGYSATNHTLLLKWRDLLYTRRALRRAPAADILVTHTFWAPLFYSKTSGKGLCYVHAARYPKGQMRYYHKAARLQTVSTPVASAIAEEIGGVRAREQISVIPYPVQLPPRYRNFAERPPADRIRLLYVGRIHPEKGIHLILEALARLIPAEQARLSLSVVGPTRPEEGGGGAAYQRALEEQSAKRSVQVEFTGSIYDAAELNEVYQGADLFLYPSLADRGETFGLAVLEAMANGLPVLVSAIPCFRDFVEPGINGEIFNHLAPDPAAELASSLQFLLQNPGLLGKLSRGARKTAEDYTEEKIARRYLQDFEWTLSNHAGA